MTETATEAKSPSQKFIEHQQKNIEELERKLKNKSRHIAMIENNLRLIMTTDIQEMITGYAFDGRGT